MTGLFFSRLILASLPFILVALISSGPGACAVSPALSSASPSSLASLPSPASPPVLSPVSISSAEQVTLAVATNFLPAARALVDAYQARAPGGHSPRDRLPGQRHRAVPMTSLKIEIAAGSSGQLLAQIKNGAPFDIFFSADVRRAEAAEHTGLGVAGMRFTYATGRLVLWSRDPHNLPISIDEPSFTTALQDRRIALANPALAPYGRAATELLDHLNLDPAMLDLVYGENISQAFSFAATGQTDLALISLSLAQHYAETSSNRGGPSIKTRAAYRLIPSSWHDPIHQQAVFLKRASLNPSAIAFWDFLHSDIARDIIAQAGYDSAIDAQSFPPATPVEPVIPADLPARAKGWLDGLGPLWLSFRLAAATTLILLVVGTPLAWWLATSASRLKPVIEAATALPLVLPPTVLGFYLLILFNPDAPFGRGWLAVTGTQLTFSFTGLVMASVIYSLPFMVQPLQASFQNIGRAPWEAGASLGARPIDRFFTIMLPLARRGLITGSILSFTHTIGEFGVILMVGGNIPGETRVISIAIYEHVETLNYGEANRLAVILLLFSFATLLWVYSTNRQAFTHAG